MKARWFENAADGWGLEAWDGKEWRSLATIIPNKSRSQWTIKQAGEGGGYLNWEATEEKAKESALSYYPVITEVLPMGLPCGTCGARRQQLPDGVNWECPNSRCPTVRGIAAP